jgi:hypothetical protein
MTLQFRLQGALGRSTAARERKGFRQPRTILGPLGGWGPIRATGPIDFDKNLEKKSRSLVEKIEEFSGLSLLTAREQ